MDEQTRQYRKVQLERLCADPSIYFKTLQIVDPNGGRTNHLNITDGELQAITDILTK